MYNDIVLLYFAENKLAVVVSLTVSLYDSLHVFIFQEEL